MRIIFNIYCRKKKKKKRKIFEISYKCQTFKNVHNLQKYVGKELIKLHHKRSMFWNLLSNLIPLIGTNVFSSDWSAKQGYYY